MTALPLPADAQPDGAALPRAGACPLVVDLDGTLIPTDTLHESALKLLRRQPLQLLQLPAWLAAGKARLKAELATRVLPDVTVLPYDDAVLACIRQARADGRPVVLCTAADERVAQAVAAHLGLFDAVIASDGRHNLSAAAKAEALVQRFGEQGFDYAGNSRDDLAVWARARRALVVNAPARVLAQARRLAPVQQVLPGPQPGVRDALRAMRPHQWLKNLLVLLPLAGAHRVGEWPLLLQALMAFVAFGLCASSVYILNDLLDLDSDRAHPRKRRRPFASGRLPAAGGLAGAALLLLLALGVAMAGRPALLQWLAVYFVLTLAYSLGLKSRVLVDCLTLGALYTLRIVAGCAAVGVPLSFWLLAFSLFLFLSLAFLKRFAELALSAQLGRPEARGRGYLVSDLPLVQVMGVAAGFCAVLVLALYINGDTASRLYAHPESLWLTVPILLYWISRMWMQAQRGHMHDDPVVFALRDRYSLACAGLFGLALWVAR